MAEELLGDDAFEESSVGVWEGRIFSNQKKLDKKKLEDRGIDPRTFHMLSERSTI